MTPINKKGAREALAPKTILSRIVRNFPDINFIFYCQANVFFFRYFIDLNVRICNDVWVIIKNGGNMDWTVILTGVGTAITVIGFLYTVLRNLKTDINSHIDRLQGDVKSCVNRLDGHAARIDQLYKMFVDLLKEKR